MKRRPALLPVIVVGSLPLLAIPASGSDDAIDQPGSEPLDYADGANWICRPGRADICAGDLSTTVIEADGTLTVQPLEADPNAPIDCFYVYPTVSRDPTTHADTSWGRDEELWATFIQAAPLGGACKVYAPGYRQVTVTGLETTGLGLDPLAFADVRAAWRRYLEHDNDGRGVILVGHSQGMTMLKQLLAEEIDARATERERLVAAYLAGGSIQVPPGADVGGDFENIPICRSPDQFGCVITWSSYRESSPPPSNGNFGKADPGMQAACANPARLEGGTATLDARFPSLRGATIMDPNSKADDGLWVEPSAGTIITPFVTLPGLVSGECLHSDAFDWLSLAVHADAGPRAPDIPGDMEPEWGMHLVDMSVVIGDLQELAVSQGTAWRAAQP